jgi:L-rhamnose mutarotase
MPRRYCLTLDLKEYPELIRQYRYWHESKNIWPEIPRGIREVGFTDMEIYLRGTRMFMIVEANDGVDFNKAMTAMAKLPRQKEWEAFVAQFQRELPGAKPGEKWMLMERVFKLP